MEKPRLTFELSDIAECTTPGCRNPAEVGMATHRSRSRGALCLAHAQVALQRWIKRERYRKRLEWMRAEFQKDLADDEETE